jgi:ribosomal protein S18 acetylase RimI-like enzyme
MRERTASESWERRRHSYVEWLSSAGAFLLVASRGERTLGFALVTFAGAYSGWESGERVAELKDIVVAPAARGQGIGSALLDRLEAELASVGVSEYRLNVIAANEDAIRLYRRRGMTHVTTVMLGRVP